MRYTYEQKQQMMETALEAIESLPANWPQFKNIVWATHHILKGGTPNNTLDQDVETFLKSKGKLQ